MKGGEIIPVEGGHVLRPAGRKDRHSKVFTSKGPKDRRVRLSAHTAIQFYDVQDRLGFDRPSKALDWLLQKARNSIDELPPCNPRAADAAAPTPSPDSNPSSGEPAIDHGQSESHDTSYYHPFNIHPDNYYLSSIKSFFPMNFPNGGCRDGVAEDLDLSLQSLHAENHWNNPLLMGFQESCCLRMGEWNNLMNCEPAANISQQEALFSHGGGFPPLSQRELIQSNLLFHSTAEHRHPPPHAHQSSDSGTPFSLGFHVPPVPDHHFCLHHDEEKNR